MVSALTFEELSAVLARMKPELLLPHPVQAEPLKRRVRAAVEYIFQDSGLNLASQVGTSTLRLGGRRVSISMEYSKAAAEAHKLGLKALDLLHLAQAHLIGQLEYSLDLFVTGDQEILSKAREIQEALDLRAVHPSDAV